MVLLGCLANTQVCLPIPILAGVVAIPVISLILRRKKGDRIAWLALGRPYTSVCPIPRNGKSRLHTVSRKYLARARIRTIGIINGTQTMIISLTIRSHASLALTTRRMGV